MKRLSENALVFFERAMSERDIKAPSTFERLFEIINIYFDQHPVLSKEIVTAKEDYFRRTGKINEYDRDFSNRANSFLLWFFFDWTLSDRNSTPFDMYLEHLKEKEDTEGLSIIESQRDHVHSIFKLTKNKKDRIIIKDILSGQKFAIPDKQSLTGCIKGSFFETRVFLLDDTYSIANYFIHHPFNVRKNIRKRIKQIRKEKGSIKSFLIQLHSFHTKWTRYRNIDIKSIYHFDKSIPEAK